MERFLRVLTLEGMIKPENTIAAMLGITIGPAIEILYGSGRIDVLNVLFAVIILDWLTGVAASFKDKTYSSEYGIAGVFRTMFILAFPALANFLDKAMGTPGFLFYAVSFGLIYHTFNSLTANAARAGWDKYIPQSLLKMVASEIKAKAERSSRKRGA